tara:strand:+ start:879 stop:1070 length:192 start_codon:yes stop_codon:yes gene_type:complete
MNMAEPAAPVDSKAADAARLSSRPASETLALSLAILEQGGSSKAMAQQMRVLAELSDSLVGKA